MCLGTQCPQHGYGNQRWDLQRSVQDTVSTPADVIWFRTENFVHLVQRRNRITFECSITPLMNRIRGYGDHRMKRMLQAILAMSFLAMLLISPVAAATSEGLEWGVALNDEFTFQFTLNEEGETAIDEGVNVTVDLSPGAIDDPLTNWSNLGFVNIDLVYTNGTSMGFEALTLLGLALVGNGFAVPIGNFSLLTELFTNSILWTENHTIINDGTYWGASISGVDDDDDVTMQVSAQYLKTDGFLARYSLTITNTTSGVVEGASFIRDGLGTDIFGLLQDNILLVGIVVGVIVLLGAVVCIRRR